MTGKTAAFGKGEMTRALTVMSLAIAVLVAPAFAFQDKVEEQVSTSFIFDTPALPNTVPLLQGRFASLEQSARSEFDEGRAELAELGSAAAANYYHEERWVVTGSTDRLISLAGQISSYTGGAHGNTNFEAMIWDATSDRPIGVIGLFTNRYHGLSMIDLPFCAGLREQQLERMGELSDDDFWAACPPHDQVAVTATGSEAGPFTEFNVRVAPYIAGPYAVGPFEVDIPMSAELLAAIKPEYRESFALPAS